MELPNRKGLRLCDREKKYTARERFCAYAWVYVNTVIKECKENK